MLASVNGIPAIYGTYLRPDSVHTSYVAGIASMDQRLVTFQLRPGAEDPGPGNWGYSPWLAAGSRTGLLATFNGGFKLDQRRGRLLPQRPDQGHADHRRRVARLLQERHGRDRRVGPRRQA